MTDTPAHIVRVGDYWDDLLEGMQVCSHPLHPLPAGLELAPGMYEHTCPGCQHVLRFRKLPADRLATAVAELERRRARAG